MTVKGQSDAWRLGDEGRTVYYTFEFTFLFELTRIRIYLRLFL